MATTINTATATTATAYSNQRKIDRCSNGVLWALFDGFSGLGAGTGIARTYYSTDNGATWINDASSQVINGSGLTAQTYTRNFSFFIDQDDFAHIVFKDNGSGNVYYRRGTPNAGRTAWTWSAAQNLQVALPQFDYPDVVAFRDPAGGGGWVAHCIYSYNDGTTNVTTHKQVSIASDGTITLGSQNNIGGSYGVAAHTYPSIDFQHTGDGKTPVASSALFAAWSAGTTGAGKGIRFKKATYSAGAWTWGTEREIDNTVAYSEVRSMVCMFDGTRVVIAGSCTNFSSTFVRIYDRDAADTTTTTQYNSGAISGTTAAYYGSSSYDNLGNVYIVGSDSTPANLNLQKWTRLGATITSSVLDNTLTTNYPYVSLKRGYSSSKIEYIYLRGSASPYSIQYASINLSTNISFSRIFKWNVLVAVAPFTRVFKWNVRTAVAPFTRTFKWNVIGGVLINRVFKWNVLQTITPIRTFKWNVRVAVAPFTRTFKWNVFQQVSLNRVFKWNVIQTVIASRVFKWNVQQVLSISRTFKWNVTGFVLIIRTYLWGVFKGWQKVPSSADIWTELDKPVDIWAELERANTGWR